MEIKVQGLDSLLKKLGRLGGNVQKSTQKALLKGGAVFEAAAKQHCPVGKTGDLRESIHTEAKDGYVEVGTNLYYAIFNEYGTGPKGDPAVPHTKKKFWRYYKDGRWHISHGQPPRPFMRPAFAEGKNQVLNVVKESIHEDVEALKK